MSYICVAKCRLQPICKLILLHVGPTVFPFISYKQSKVDEFPSPAEQVLISVARTEPHAQTGMPKLYL